MSKDRSVSWLPEAIAGYRLIRPVGRGGMSMVYLAEHVHLDRQVAVKILPPPLAEDEQFRERFIRESRSVARLEHPNIVAIYDAGEFEGLLYLVMRYISGGDLRHILRQRARLDLPEVVAIAEQIGGALAAAHELGLVHRDVKPGNILLDQRAGQDFWILGDFGITKRAASVTKLTGSGQFLGTLDYIAPEQIKGAAIDERTDIYSLGCVIFECLTGAPPFSGDSHAAMIYAHMHTSPLKVTHSAPHLPRTVDAVFDRALAKAPQDRQSSCLEFAAELRQVLEDAPEGVPGNGATTTVVGAPIPLRKGGQPRTSEPHPVGKIDSAEATTALAPRLMPDATPPSSTLPPSSPPEPSPAQVPSSSPVPVVSPIPVPSPVAVLPPKPVLPTAAALPTVVPDPPPAPNAPPGEEKNRRAIILIAIAAVLWLGLGTALAVILSASRDDTPQPSTLAPATDAPAIPAAAGSSSVSATPTAQGAPVQPVPTLPGADDFQRLSSLVAPDTVCNQVISPNPAARAALDCHNRQFHVTYTLFADDQAADAHFTSQVSKQGAVVGTCGETANPLFQLYHQGDRGRAAGQVLCYQIDDGSHIMWTQRGLGVVTTAHIYEGGQAHHVLFNEWAADAFGPRFNGGAVLQRGRCSASECQS